MRSDWDDEEAAAMQRAAGDDAADRELALRVYTSRLIGRVPALVMHGGGNTSVKLRRRDRSSAPVDVLHVKGSGWDLSTIAAPGLPAVRIEPLLEARSLDALPDDDMVALQRANLLDPASPSPSVETLLHAFLPHRYVDHTHATAMLVLANQPDVHAICAELFGDRVALVDYVMPGFALAKRAAEVYEANPNVEGLLLVNHGHFTFGDDARSSYERMIAHVSTAEAYIAGRLGAEAAPADPAPLTPEQTAALPALRGALADDDGRMPIFDLRRTAAIDRFLGRENLDDLATRGVATPDHVIRTKRFPLVVRLDDADDAAATATVGVAAYRAAYRAYVARQVERAGPRVMLDASPRVLWVPGLGVIGCGADAKAAAIAADLAEQTIEVIAAAEAVGAYRPVGENDTFDMEYWPLEQAKLGKSRAPELQGRVVLVTGAGGAIGLATARAFRALGAELFAVDVDASSLAAVAEAIPGVRTICCDLTERDGAAEAFAACARELGGVDIVVSNAGAAWTGTIGSVEESKLRASFELNFWAHQRVAQAAVAVFRAQGSGGCLLFNVSKQAVNPGTDFGPYGLPKAALMALLRQYALDHGHEGIRANGVNADRIRSGLLDDAMIAARSAARGVSEGDYMAGNLLRREVTAEHVAQAFVALARAERTTGHVMTVDGGNVAATLR